VGMSDATQNALFLWGDQGVWIEAQRRVETVGGSSPRRGKGVRCGHKRQSHRKANKREATFEKMRIFHGSLRKEGEADHVKKFVKKEGYLTEEKAF